jgi:parvulin-like peptidyl-prolyl isomerase
VPEPPADEVRTAFEDTLREWRSHGASWDLLDAQRESLRAETISHLRMDRFTRSLWSELPELTYDDLRTWYRENLSRFRTPAAAKVLHLARFPESPDPWDDYAAMLDFRRRALDGEDFATLAAAHTQKKGGETDLGWIEQQRLLNPFEAMLFSLREGEVSPVFHYEQAYHLVKVIEVRVAAVQSFEEVAESIREEVERTRRLQVLKDLAAELRAKAVIERD